MFDARDLKTQRLSQASARKHQRSIAGDATGGGAAPISRGTAAPNENPGHWRPESSSKNVRQATPIRAKVLPNGAFTASGALGPDPFFI